MDPVKLAGDLRLLRSRRGWTQRRLAAEAGVSRWAVAEIEAGRGDRITPRQLIRVVSALGAYLQVRILYQGEGLDRLRDRRHAALVEAMVAQLRADGWDVATEVTFSVYGERGSIDILAFHAPSGTLLIIEVKSVVPDVGGMLATLDRKVRLAPDLARARGWPVGTIARLLVLPEDSSARRRVTDHQATFANAFPARNVEVNRWLRRPSGPMSGPVPGSMSGPVPGSMSGPMSGLMFLSSARRDGQRRPPRSTRATPARPPRSDLG